MSVTAGEENGLDQDSVLMVDKDDHGPKEQRPRTVVGRLAGTTLVEFERRLLVFLGFGA